jgi:hypothetical protein
MKNSMSVRGIEIHFMKMALFILFLSYDQFTGMSLVLLSWSFFACATLVSFIMDQGPRDIVYRVLEVGLGIVAIGWVISSLASVALGFYMLAILPGI